MTGWTPTMEAIARARRGAERWVGGRCDPGPWEVATWEVVQQLLGEHGVEVDAARGRTLRWLCGWEIESVANIVDLICSGR